MIINFNQLHTLFSIEDLYLTLISILVGLCIGAEREYKNKAAGLRTFMLVCLGSCIFTILSLKIGVQNPDRLAANIITGIGFLGAGAIFKDENRVNGITTACTIWVTAALGMCIGSGHIYLALLSLCFVFLVLWKLIAFEKWIDKKNKVTLFKITTIYKSDTIVFFEKIFTENHLKHTIHSQVKNNETYTVIWRIEGQKKYHEKLTDLLLNEPRIIHLEI